MTSQPGPFLKPTPIEGFFNRAFGFLVRIGLAFPHNYVLEVRGRKSGRTYSTPVNLLNLNGKRFLVAARGYTQWVRNALAAGDVTLKKAWTRRRFEIRALANDEKPEVLKAYLDRFKLSVQRYFPLAAGSEPEAFVPLADRYPVFELLRLDS